MKQAYSLQRQQRKHGSPATTAFSFAEPTRLFAPVTAPSAPVFPHERQEQPGPVAQFRHSFDRLSIRPPVPDGGAGHEVEQSGEQSAIQQQETQSSSVQRKEAERQSTPKMGAPLQKVADLGPAQGNNTGMPDALKTGIETLSGLAMDDVRVHYNSAKPAQVDALAYTQGTEIHVGPGQEQHLAHEAWHVVQQKQGRVVPTLQMKDVAINDDQALEREADVMGAKGAGELQRYPSSTYIAVYNNRSTVMQRYFTRDGEKLEWKTKQKHINTAIEEAKLKSVPKSQVLKFAKDKTDHGDLDEYIAGLISAKTQPGPVETAEIAAMGKLECGVFTFDPSLLEKGNWISDEVTVGNASIHANIQFSVGRGGVGDYNVTFGNFHLTARSLGKITEIKSLVELSKKENNPEQKEAIDKQIREIAALSFHQSTATDSANWQQGSKDTNLEQAALEDMGFDTKTAFEQAVTQNNIPSALSLRELFKAELEAKLKAKGAKTVTFNV